MNRKPIDDIFFLFAVYYILLIIILYTLPYCFLTKKISGFVIDELVKVGIIYSRTINRGSSTSENFI